MVGRAATPLTEWCPPLHCGSRASLRAYYYRLGQQAQAVATQSCDSQPGPRARRSTRVSPGRRLRSPPALSQILFVVRAVHTQRVLQCVRCDITEIKISWGEDLSSDNTHVQYPPERFGTSPAEVQGPRVTSSVREHTCNMPGGTRVGSWACVLLAAVLQPAQTAQNGGQWEKPHHFAEFSGQTNPCATGSAGCTGGLCARHGRGPAPGVCAWSVRPAALHVLLDSDQRR